MNDKKLKFHIVIPARYNSSRLPKKLLKKINGKSLLQLTFENASKSNANSIIIATDSNKIKNQAKTFNANTYITSKKHKSGIERISEIINIVGLQNNEIIVNVQGDEPLIPPKLINKVAKTLHDKKNIQISTLSSPITNYKDVFNPNITKVIFDTNKHAMIFTRSPIPWDRNKMKTYNINEKKIISKNLYFKHIGLFAYTVNTIKKYMDLKKSPFEKIEYLEQLRMLWHGYKILIIKTNIIFPNSIDTADDWKNLVKFFNKNKQT